MPGAQVLVLQIKCANTSELRSDNHNKSVYNTYKAWNHKNSGGFYLSEQEYRE